MSYTLRYPITLVQPHQIDASGEPAPLANGLTFRLAHAAGYHVLEVTGFSSPEEAMEFDDRLWTALMWCVLQLHTAFKVNAKARVASLVDDPVEPGRRLEEQFGLAGPVDAVIDAALPAVYPTGARLRMSSAGSVTVASRYPLGKFLPVLQEGVELAARLTLSPRLRTALELYNSHHYEASATARLVVLVMCLEVLAEAREKHPVALALIDRWQQELDREAKATADSDAASSLESLRRELLFRREESLRGRVRRLALEAFADEPADEREKRARQAVEIYDLRSTLVHEGTLPPDQLGRAVEEARDLVSEILRRRIRATVGADVDGRTKADAEPQ